MAQRAEVSYLKEKFPKANYAQLPPDNEVYQKIKLCIAKVKEDAENNRLLSLDGVTDCNNGNHYIAYVSGGANGSGDWVDYFETFKGIIKGLNKFGEAWLIELNNNCCDDVHYALIGFRNAPSSFAVTMDFVNDNPNEGSTSFEYKADETAKVLKKVKLFCRNTWPRCKAVVITRT